MKIEEIAVQALARCSQLGHDWPSVRSVMYRRIGVRQQQLFARAAVINPEFFGVCAVGPLDAEDSVDLKDLGEPVYPAELVSRVEIADKGTSAYVNEQEVHVVALTDADVALAPRVTVRNGVVKAVGADLTDVTSLRVFYSRRPFPIDPTDANVEAELPEPFQELLVIDLTRYLVRQNLNLAATLRQDTVALLDAEELEILAGYDAHVQAFTSAVEKGRFARTTTATRQ